MEVFNTEYVTINVTRLVDVLDKISVVYKSASVNYTERKPKNKNEGGLGTRLCSLYNKVTK